MHQLCHTECIQGLVSEVEFRVETLRERLSERDVISLVCSEALDERLGYVR